MLSIYIIDNMDDETKHLLHEIYYDNRSGYMKVNELIRRTREYNIPPNVVKSWHKSQPVKQIIIPRRQEIKYHKPIGNGNGYQADIIFFPYPKINRGNVGMLTFINTTTRMAFVNPIKN